MANIPPLPTSQRKTNPNPWNDPPHLRIIGGDEPSATPEEKATTPPWPALVAFLAILGLAVLAGIGVVHLLHCAGA